MPLNTWSRLIDRFMSASRRDSKPRRRRRVALTTVALESLEQRRLLTPLAAVPESDIAELDNAPQAVSEITVEFTDANGNRLNQVTVGQEFTIQILVTDLRESPGGVFSAYTDVSYRTDLIDVTSIEHHFGLAASGVINEPAGIVDEVGGGNIDIAATGEAQLLLSLTATATQPGELTVGTDAPDAPDSVITLLGLDTDQRENTSFGQATLSILPDDTTDIRRFDLDGNGVVSFGDVSLFATHMGQPVMDDGERAEFDFDGNGVISFGDVALFAAVFGQRTTDTAPAPAPATTEVTLAKGPTESSQTAKGAAGVTASPIKRVEVSDQSQKLPGVRHTSTPSLKPQLIVETEYLTADTTEVLHADGHSEALPVHKDVPDHELHDAVDQVFGDAGESLRIL